MNNRACTQLDESDDLLLLHLLADSCQYSPLQFCYAQNQGLRPRPVFYLSSPLSTNILLLTTLICYDSSNLLKGWILTARWSNQCSNIMAYNGRTLIISRGILSIEILEHLRSSGSATNHSPNNFKGYEIADMGSISSRLLSKSPRVKRKETRRPCLAIEPYVRSRRSCWLAAINKDKSTGS
jgi:hypothetical protein